MVYSVQPELIDKATQLFKDGRTYKEISKQLDLPMNVIASVMSCMGAARYELQGRRVMSIQMAKEGVPVEDIADSFGISVNTIKNDLRKARVKYKIRQK